MADVLSGQITVTTAGTAVQGTSVRGTEFYIAAHPGNTGAIWVGSDGAGDVTNANGYPLKPGDSVVVRTSNLNNLWFDADVNGEKACWLRRAT